MASITVWIATAFLCTGDGCVQMPDHTSRRFDSKAQCEDVILRAIDKMWERHQLVVQAVCTPYFLSSTETPGFYSPPPQPPTGLNRMWDNWIRGGGLPSYEPGRGWSE
ncbi:hypothetical protein H6S67_gp15 [Pseudomonas phage PaGU11]|uniref:Uncharacterized protein n=1 Tax=Pseudomonas phage PaGU11 TaxID=2203191 RepID=A0A6J3ZX99_9CAUD|nr:hypothetical protein H6S67_gp15 [Pseudomonas phage PaGU11]BBF63705.1 hypothetical protein PaGU11_00015 [Pseudomonas phage PaGU11]